MEERNTESKRPLDVIIAEEDIKVKKIYNTLDLTKPTWYKKRNDPKNFTVGEVITLASLLNKTPEQIIKVLKEEIDLMEKQK